MKKESKTKTFTQAKKDLKFFGFKVIPFGNSQRLSVKLLGIEFISKTNISKDRIIELTDRPIA